jgi:YVTN family beta-propeller protein
MRINFLPIALCCAGLSNVCGAGSAYIANDGGNVINVVNLDTFAITATIGAGSAPITELISGTRLYVLNADSNNLTIIDTAAGQVIATVIVGDTPRFMALSADNTKLYVPNDTDQVIVVNTSTFQVIATVTVPDAADVVQGPTNMYVGSSSNANVIVISQSTQAIIATITVGASPGNLLYDSSRVYAVNINGATVSIINIGTNQVISTVTVGATPTDIGIANGLAFVTNAGSSTVSVINTVGSPPSVIATVTVGAGPFIVRADTVHNQIFLGIGNSQISVINSAAPFATIATLPAINSPNVLSLTPDSSQLYVTYSGSNIVNVINTTSHTFVGTITLSNLARDVVFGESPLQMPSRAVGEQTKNEFLGQTELVNVINWSSPTNGSTPVSYLIFRNAALTDLAGTVSASAPLQFVDHNRRKRTTYTYYIVSVDLHGNRSTPAIVAVAP